MNTNKLTSLPTNPADRKAAPMAEGLLWYFPNALAAIARVSKAGNDQHNPGQPLHWARGKSMDHADCIIRHLVEAGTMDTDGIRHSAKVAWRALALLQEELEREEGYPLPRNAKLVKEIPVATKEPAPAAIDNPYTVVIGGVPDVQTNLCTETTTVGWDGGVAGYGKPGNCS